MITEDELYQLIISNPNKLYNITHIGDFDGIGSAAILAHYAGMPVEHVIFSSYSEEEIAHMKEGILRLNPSNSTIIFSDLSINDRSISAITDILTMLKKKGNRIAWFDHHSWSKKAINEVSKFCDFIICGENPEYCGAELVYKVMSKSGTSAEKIAKTAHLTDFNLRTESNKNILDMLACTITFINYSDDNEENLRKLVKIISNLDFENEFIKDKYSSYNTEAAKNIKLLKENMVASTTGKYKVGIGYGKHIHKNAACACIEDKLGTDIELFIDVDKGKMSIRSRNGIDCSILAKALEGGGHPQAAAAEIEDKSYLKSKDGLNDLMKILINKAKEVYAVNGTAK